jgi:hypothetical protein
MGEYHPLDNSLSHVPDVGERRIVQTAPGIEKDRSPDKDPGPDSTSAGWMYATRQRGPVAPNFVGEVTTENAPQFFGYLVPSVEEPARGEVVSLAVLLELLVRSKLLIRIVL